MPWHAIGVGRDAASATDINACRALRMKRRGERQEEETVEAWAQCSWSHCWCSSSLEGS